MKIEIEIDEGLVRRLEEVADLLQITFNEAVNRAIIAGLPFLGQKAESDNLGKQPTGERERK